MSNRIVPAAAALLAVGPAAAQGVDARVGLSTLGLTGSLSYDVTPDVALRGMVAGARNYTTDVDDVDLGFGGDTTGEADLTFTSIGVMAEYGIGRSGAFVSGGLLYLDADVSGSATGQITLESGATANTTLEADLSFENDVAPILSAGFARQMRDGFSIYGEFGAILTGGVDLRLEETGGSNFTRQELDAEEDAFLDDFGLEVYPFVSLGAQFQF